MKKMFRSVKYDLPASIVVFFVAVPLCLGIALASGAPLFSGIIAGIVGGIVVGSLSGSPLGVSGPAAGLAVIVFQAIETLGSYEAFLLAVVLAGILQIILGYIRAGIIAYYFPSSVIKGMLTGIGILIIIKQIPYAFGFIENSGGFSLENIRSFITPGAVVISVVSLTILIIWDTYLQNAHKIFKLIQGPIVTVIMGIILVKLFDGTSLQVGPEQLVTLPVFNSVGDIAGSLTMPDLGAFANPQVYGIAITMAIVASLETLLSVEAVDKLDRLKRVTPTNRELRAQGIGNILSGMIGGLPITQVIVRSSANVTFGGKTKKSAIMHGFMLLICATTIPVVLNMIPLSALACILIVVGFKLSKPVLFKTMYKEGWEQFLPFIVTIIVIIFTDLLKGIGVGMVISLFFVLRSNYINPFFKDRGKSGETVIQLSEDVSFLNKASIRNTLQHVQPGAHIVIDGSQSKRIDHDVLEIISEFKRIATNKKINLEIIGIEHLLKKISNGNIH